MFNFARFVECQIFIQKTWIRNWEKIITVFTEVYLYARAQRGIGLRYNVFLSQVPDMNQQEQTR
jgi:hypothetical protein